MVEKEPLLIVREFVNCQEAVRVTIMHVPAGRHGEGGNALKLRICVVFVPLTKLYTWRFISGNKPFASFAPHKTSPEVTFLITVPHKVFMSHKRDKVFKVVTARVHYQP